MYFGEKPRKGLSKFVAVLTALAIASASLLAVPAYAAESGVENQNPVVEFFGNVADGAAQLFGFAPEADNAQLLVAGVDSDTVVDASTRGTWEQVNDNTTQNVGRIWTDKSVSDEDITLSPSNITISLNEEGSDAADFLVSLSAFSSASNAVSASTKPLDIVLLLDTSGSMAYYMPVYEAELDRSETYYRDEEGYSSVTWNSRENSWGYYESSWGGDGVGFRLILKTAPTTIAAPSSMVAKQRYRLSSRQ